MGKRNKLSACVYDPVFIEGGALIMETVYIAGGCLWSDIFYKEDNGNEMVQCQKCDYRR